MTLNEFLNDLELKIINAVDDVDSIERIDFVDEDGDILEIERVAEDTLELNTINIQLKVADG